ncbi:MAG: M18 family aminopeptidase [Halioglobus sp.]|nr:M18 family aminopeptidase [Halioglobus sp.]
MTRDDFNPQLCEFLGRATTPFHAVADMAAMLCQAGFEQLQEGEPWELRAGNGYFVTRNGSSIIAYVHGESPPGSSGVRMVGAHTDSPCLMVKPQAEVRCKGYLQLGVQVYGGALLNPWFDRDLSLAGRVSYRTPDGQLRSALIDFRRAIAVIPSLAIHLDRDANNERSVNPQKDMPPVLCQLGEEEEFALRDLLRSQLTREHPGIEVAEILDFELSFYDSQPAAVVGLNDQFIASARLDNLLSCFVGLQALLQADRRQSALLVCNDHEEVGSQSAIGAQGPFLLSFLKRLAGSEEAYAALAARSLLISADNAHGVHPNFTDRHDDNHGPLLNAGPVIKVNASQRYATNSETSGLFRMLCKQADVPVQTFVVRSDMACGSTIGPITSGVTGIPTLDIGVATFAMHSIRELAGADDARDLARVLTGFFDHAGELGAG